ncbi:MAG: DUF5719 family protein, partial [Nocardioides sp.]|nr:DUF5719 family protein [Nocardioides sp.]
MSGKHGQTPRQKKGMASGLAVGLAAVLVTGGALALQVTPPDPTDPVVEEPTSVPLTSAALACPAALPDAADLTIGRAPGGDASSVEGSLEKRPSNRAKRSALKVGADAVTTVQAEQATVVSGTGSMAPGLFGARFGTEKAPAAGECVTPAGERWFPGLGAGGFHESRLLLANPDKGPAVVDLTIWSRTGPMRKVESRGLTIPASKSSEINLAELAPEREELAVQVTVSRGRVAVSTQDTYTPQGAEATTDWFPWTAPPANEQVIPGLPRKADENTLVLINPGADEGRVSLKVRGADSEFAPTGLSDIRVPAGRVVVTELTDKLKQAIAKEDTSLAITSTVPVAASLRTVV